ncbi:heavy metal-associated isoprenylated plant protein 35-like isoform X2 [Rhodamnia argentea]|uniref:Heavy metal-associated isoprenylated plant protein 35-like isoform X2 n=1 Tax=Rhodamnia argentea TaxID=178133 RepID=A0A8B8QH54_9MYRT|nr:heavy metal-associated isoprenylated plant protein 35-like isoform X2 [Rhodamnia argentea]
MIPAELEKPRVTEIHVRMDCNGCVQKIKKALHGINGIYDLYIDFPQQKLTIVGWADPERIVKAIRKTRKNATICSHKEPSSDEPSQPTEQAPNGGAPPPAEATNPSQPEAPPSEPPKEPLPQENPPPPPPQQAENPQPDANPPPAAAANPQQGQPPQQEDQSPQPSMPKDVGEVHVLYHHPPDYGYRPYGYNCGYNGHYYRYPSSSSHQTFRHEPPPPPPPPPVYVTHSYNTYKPSPYVTEYAYMRSPPPQYNYSQYRSIDHYGEASYSSYAGAAGSGNITSIFSDENPNACRVM